MRSPLRGAPLAMVGLLLAAWVGGRALFWQSPFPVSEASPVEAGEPQVPPVWQPAIATVPVADGRAAAPAAPDGPVRSRPLRGQSTMMLLASGSAVGMRLHAAVAPPVPDDRPDAALASPEFLAASAADGVGNPSPPFLAPSVRPTGNQPGKRWSVDAWGFWREGSDAAPITQGRVPIYGASQIGAVLQYRLSPGSGKDLRLYARAYRAMVERGESELAFGASLRPLREVPVRVLGELRLTDGAFRTEARPSALAVTEIAPLVLPFGTRLETYAQAGWVGGTDATFFADGQASLTREIGALSRATGERVRLSVGGGAWGGAQEGAHRIDLGPTVRLDTRVGRVPARLSLDWREKVEGDAGPESGLAVTLSSGF